MADRAQVFVRQELVPQRPAPVRTTGAIAWIRSRLFGSPTSILLTIVSRRCCCISRSFPRSSSC